MRRTLLTGVLALSCWLAGVSVTSAQVFVRAPFVRVEVGPGVSVRAPFFNLYLPPAGPVVVPGPVYTLPPPSVYVPPTPKSAPPIDVVPSTTVPSVTVPSGTIPTGPPPRVAPPDLSPPVPSQPARAITLQQFANSFKPKAGSFDVEVINPVTKQPTRVQFTLPEGSPKRVIVNANDIEFRYGVLRFVRLEFDADGVQVTSRLGRQ
jgi:hypothetical protein